MSQNEEDFGDILEEMEALRAIFPDLDITDMSDSESQELRLEVNFMPTSGLVNFSVVMTKDYPNIKPPTYHFWAPNFSSGAIEAIKRRLDSIWAEFTGQPILYQWVEAVLEELQERDGAEIPDVRRDVEEDANVIASTLAQMSVQHYEEEVKECPEIHTGPAIEDRKGVFQGHFASITSPDQVKTVLNKLKSNPKIGRAFHNMWAYRIRNCNGQIAQDCDDDGEAHAGGRLSHLLDILDCSNHMVIVSRWYGGIHLGPDRFKHINNAARSVMEQAEAIPKTSAKKGKK